MAYKLKLVLAGVMGVTFATGTFAAGNQGGNGNAGQGGVSFNAVLHSNGLPSGISDEIVSIPAGTTGKGIGSIASELAHTGGGVSVASAAGGVTNIVASVPEPDAYLMLLAGLGMVGVIARRRAAR